MEQVVTGVDMNDMKNLEPRHCCGNIEWASLKNTVTVPPYKINSASPAWCHILIIPALCEAEVAGSQGRPLVRTCLKKFLNGGEIAQCQGCGFSPQWWVNVAIIPWILAPKPGHIFIITFIIVAKNRIPQMSSSVESELKLIFYFCSCCSELLSLHLYVSVPLHLILCLYQIG